MFCHIHARVQESWAKLMSLQILQGGIQPWAPAGGGARVGAQSAPPPLENQENFLPVIWGNFCFIFSLRGLFQVRVQGGGGLKGLRPPPLEIEKKKKKKKVIRTNIKLFHRYFATFLVENVIFSVRIPRHAPIFYYVFLIIVIALRGGGGNSRQLSPLNKIRYLHGRLFAVFSLPFLHVRAFLLRFSHYNFPPAEGGGQVLAFDSP